MKCAISLPDELFDEVDRQAQRLGISRSEFLATAAARYVDDLAYDDRVVAIDAVVAEHGEAIAQEMDWVRDAGPRSLMHVDWSDDDPS